jgi:hypothetical protein
MDLFSNLFSSIVSSPSFSYKSPSVAVATQPQQQVQIPSVAKNPCDYQCFTSQGFTSQHWQEMMQ